MTALPADLPTRRAAVLWRHLPPAAGLGVVLSQILWILVPADAQDALTVISVVLFAIATRATPPRPAGCGGRPPMPSSPSPSGGPPRRSGPQPAGPSATTATPIPSDRRSGPSRSLSRSRGS